MGELSLHALSGNLQDQPILKDLLIGLKSLDSQRLEDFLAALPTNLSEDPEILEIRDHLRKLTQEQERAKANSRGAAAKRPTQKNAEYTKITDRVHDIVQGYFMTSLINPQDLFLHEVLLFDLRVPLKDVFAPKSRFAIERALSSPFDYLISTSEPQTGKLSAKQPASAILFHLYLEAGALVNVYDLWSTFHTVFENTQGDDCDDRMTMTLFYRALSELKALGLIKNSRRKTDHIVKLAWSGL